MPRWVEMWTSLNHNVQWDMCWLTILARARKHLTVTEYDWKGLLPVFAMKARQLMVIYIVKEVKLYLMYISCITNMKITVTVRLYRYCGWCVQLDEVLLTCEKLCHDVLNYVNILCLKLSIYVSKYIPTFFLFLICLLFYIW